MEQFLVRYLDFSNINAGVKQIISLHSLRITRMPISKCHLEKVEEDES